MNPHYGLADETRLQALRVAQEVGTKKASEICKVGVSSIRRWRKCYDLKPPKNDKKN